MVKQITSHTKCRGFLIITNGVFVGEYLNMVGRQLLFIHNVTTKVPQLQSFVLASTSLVVMLTFLRQVSVGLHTAIDVNLPMCTITIKRLHK